MLCYLCLKDPASQHNIVFNNKYIEFDSTEAEVLDLKNIIEKHFWLELNNAPVTSYCICECCWQNVLTFHNFYLNVETAHKVLLLEIPMETKVEPQAELGFELTKPEIEGNSNKLINTCVPCKHGQRCLIETVENTKIFNDDKKQFVEVVLEEINLNDIKFETPDADLTMTDVLENNENIDEDDNTTKYRCRRKPKERKGKKKRTISYKTEKSLEFDSYIKANFKLHCHMCNEELNDFTKLLLHFRTEHKQRGYATCCGKKFLKRGLLVDHLHRHKDPEYFKCRICDQVLGDRRSLELHIKLHDEKYKERIYKCSKCPKSYYNHAVFLRHQLTHIPEEQRTVACSHCNKLFPTNSSMQQHYKLVHLNKYAKICDVCGKSIRGKDALARHMNEHAGVEPQLVQCDICGISLTTKYGLARHKKMMHTEENRRPVKCEVCSKVSASLRAHLTHMKYTHQLQHKHSCPMCDKAFRRKNELKEHITTHTGDVLYTCPHCPKTFNSNANMYSHRKKCHPKEWEESRLLKYQKKTQGIGSGASSILALSVRRTVKNDLDNDYFDV